MVFSEILSLARIKVPLTGRTKWSVIEELVDLIDRQIGLVGRDQALEAVLSRERAQSTGVGNGLAIPHGKTTGTKKLVMAVGKPERPLDFRSIDRRPSKLIVLLLSPPDQIGPHIEALARICRIATCEHCRDKLYAAETAMEILDTIVTRDREMCSDRLAECAGTHRFA